MPRLHLVASRRAVEPADTNEVETTLLSRIAQGDRDAFDTFYRTYFRRLQRFLGKVLSHPALIDEVLDDTMVVVWQRAHTFNGTSRVSTWVFGIAHNKAYKALERERRLSSVAGEASGFDWVSELTPATASADPQGDLMAAQLRRDVRRQIAQLPAEQRTVVELTYFHDRAYKEIAQIVGCPEDTVKTRMFHARRKLRALLMALGPGWES